MPNKREQTGFWLTAAGQTGQGLVQEAGASVLSIGEEGAVLAAPS